MKIEHAYGSPYEDYEHGVAVLDISLEEGETLTVGDIIRIELMDDTVIKRDVKLIDPEYCNDYYDLCPKKAQQEGWKRTTASVKTVSGKRNCRVAVLDLNSRDVKTQENLDAKEWFDEMQKKFCLTPYEELGGGEESIYDHIDKAFSVPEKVIRYLQTKELLFLCPGIYNHPFKENCDLLGPYYYTDGYYFWDRDTWKYVLKYGLTLPQQFIDYVMSDAADAFLAQHHNSDWHLQERENTVNLLPKDSGDVPFDEF